MLIQFKSSTLLSGARRLKGPVVLIYGMHQTLELDCIDADRNPINIQSRNYGKWRVRITPDLSTPSNILLERTYDHDIAVASRLVFDFCTTTQEMYEYIKGAAETPVVLELCAFANAGCEEPSATIQLPFNLVSSSDALLKPTSFEIVEQAKEYADEARRMAEAIKDADSLEWRAIPAEPGAWTEIKEM